jgi:hypothetical protein
VTLAGPLGYETFDAKDLTEGLCVVRIERPGMAFDAVTRRGIPIEGGYFVACARLGMTVSPPFKDWYQATAFGNFLQKKHEWKTVRAPDAEQLAALQTLVRDAVAEFAR